MKHLVPIVLCALSQAAHVVAQDFLRESVWDSRAAEHLLNRAGFGASPEEVARAVERGRAATIERLFAGDPEPLEPFFHRVRRRGAMDDLRTGEGPPTAEERRELQRRIRGEDTRQLRDFLGWWFERMLAGDDPLRERMTLFWHGHFTSSMDDVKNSHEMIEQNRLFRRLGLGDFRTLVEAIARDPAMLEYLDNDVSRRGDPNENFARELMELFTLGEGNYTEADVKEAARAFTGWTDADGVFRFQRKQHDFGQKTVLGRTGRLDGDDVIDVLVEHDACARFLATKLLRYFEGVEPSGERVAEYARLLRDAELDVGALLRALFADPRFYRDEVVGARIASPVDFLVGTARRCRVEPPAALLLLGANLLGERLLFPPNVEGWEGGASWITTGGLLQRGNLAGVLLGEVTLDDFVDEDLEAELGLQTTDDAIEALGMDAGVDDDPDARLRRRRALGDLRKLRELLRSWRPRLNLTGALSRAGARSDQELTGALADRLLAVPVDATTLSRLTGLLRAEREALGVDEGALLERPWESEPSLRRLAHVLLSLPEAQLH